jgi:hypothetical protein
MTHIFELKKKIVILVDKLRWYLVKIFAMISGKNSKIKQIRKNDKKHYKML